MTDRIHTVGIVAIQGGRVLLVKHGVAADHLTGVWGLPGGRLSGSESLLDAAVREFEEETGLILTRESMLQIPTVYQGDINRKNGEILKTYWNVFVVTNFIGEMSGTDETMPEWIEIEKISELENLLPNTENAVREGLQLVQR